MKEGLSKERARDVLDSVAARLRTPQALQTARVDSLAVGYPGIALLFTTLAADGDTGARSVAHAHLAAAIRPAGGLRAAGLYGGTAAVAFAARVAATGPDTYRSLLDSVTPRVAEAAVERARALRAGRSQGTGAPSHLYDAVSGASGLARLLLALDPHGPALRACLEALVDLAEPAVTAHGTLPGWWTEGGPGVQGPNPDFPRGHLNLGLAHGIPGPLALLSLAHEQGVRVRGHEEAIGRFAGWLAGRAHGDGYGPYWPLTVRAEDELSGERPPNPPTRAAWCYGTPGAARALFLAGRALEEKGWRELAGRAMRAALARPAATRALEGPGLCHGTGGLLQIAARMAYDLDDAELSAQLPCLARQLVEEMVEVDGVGFLEGAAGAALALHTYVEGVPSPGVGSPSPELLGWDAALLLG
ncbi:lanthionine synthetase C family protein [Streptomyces sp. WM6378]|uniref:lanthionine synthetase C family protein n=1 Tax=Streptomyces sp. WM6378 TaxID=1415557 RepID=UPI0006ADB721|nr:lanthionine synthetase C family protein [Streptomyces sp. WM6378]